VNSVGCIPYRIDELVAELVAKGLVKGVAVPRNPRTHFPGHWEPTILTLEGKKFLWGLRRSRRVETVSWWTRVLRFGG
jgi:hypothetical protein